MKRIFTIGLISPAALFLAFGTAAAVYAQKEQEKEAKPEKPQQEQKQPAKPAQHKPAQAQQQPKQQAKPAQQKPERAQQEPKQQAKPAQQKPEQAKQEPKQEAKPAQHKPAQAQQQPKQQAKPAQHKPAQAQQQPKQQAKPAQHKQQAQSAQSRGGNPVPQRSKQVAQGWQQQRGWLKQGGGWQGNNSWQQERATSWQSQHRTWAERGGYGGYYIPDATFTLDFGDQHWFRITSQPTIVGGFPRFQHDGFWFMLVDPWPESWSQNWYATDDVYVGYNNGYYLYNRTDPGDAIAISIVL